MPLPSSGPISINQIRTELASGSYSLRALSAAAGKSTPDAMSEFYGFSSSLGVDITVYIPGYVECYNIYSATAESSQAVNTNVNVGFTWYGDLGGSFSGSVTIPSGNTCGRNDSIDSGGGVSCTGEYNANLFVSLFPTSNGSQNYNWVSYAPIEFSPC